MQLSPHYPPENNHMFMDCITIYISIISCTFCHPLPFLHTYLHSFHQPPQTLRHRGSGSFAPATCHQYCSASWVGGLLLQLHFPRRLLTPLSALLSLLLSLGSGPGLGLTLGRFCNIPGWKPGPHKPQSSGKLGRIHAETVSLLDTLLCSAARPVIQCPGL